MSNENLESGQPLVTKESLADMVREIFAKPSEFAEAAKNMPTKLVVYLLVLTVCSLITMVFHQQTPATTENKDEQS